MWDALKNICLANGILVELTFFLYKTGESMLDTSMRPYIVDTVCLDVVNENETVCSNLGQFMHEEDKVQRTAAKYLMYYRLLVNIPAIVLGLFCGAWSDKSGRKIPMMLPSLGSVLAVLLYMISLIDKKGAMGFILAGALVQGIFGKSSVITMAVNSYVSDTSETTDRTKKLGRLQAMNFFGMFVGSLITGSLADTAGFEAIMCSVVFVHGASIIVTLAFISETRNSAEQSQIQEIKESNTVSKIKCNVFAFLSVFKPSNFKDSLLVLFRYRESHMRHIIIILVIVSIVNQTCKSGEIDISVLFVERSPLNWPKSWFGYMLALDYAIMGFCLFFFLPVLSNVFLLGDVPIIMIALSFRIIRLIWMAFAKQTWMVYFSVVIGAFGGLIASAARSLLSKSVNEDELGKTFAILASGETASKLLGTVIFANIYGASAHFFTGFAYIIEAIVYALLFLTMIWFRRYVNAIETYNVLNESSLNYSEIDGETLSINETTLPPPEDLYPDKRTTRFHRGNGELAVGKH